MMRIRTSGLYVCLWAVLVLAAMARAAASSSPATVAAITLFWAAVQGAGLFFAYAHKTPASPKTVERLAGVGLLAFVLELLLADLVQALMSLLLWLQAARNPALTTRRDAYFALLISLALVAFGASMARDSLFVIVLVGYGLAALGVLAYCHQQRGADRERLIRMPSSVAPGISALHLGALGAAVFVLALGWYLLVPRPDAPQLGAISVVGGQEQFRKDWEQEAKTGSHGRGGGETPARRRSDDSLDIMQSGSARGAAASAGSGPTNGGTGAGRNRILMYVQSDRALYLRRRSFDHFEQDRWSDDTGRSRKLLPVNGEFHLAPDGPGDKVQYVVQMLGPIGDALPLSAHAVSLQAPAGVIAQGSDGAVHLPGKIEAGFTYRAWSLLPQGRPVSRTDAPDPVRHLQKPEGFSTRIGELARSVTAGADTPAAKAAALESHLRTSYAYSLETVATSQNVTPLEDFLFDTRRGHCEFFASAMAMMLREIDIPSRVVHGYLSHTYNPVTGFYEVRALDGHAWVEGWFDGVGWVTFEPTAAYPMPASAQQTGTTLEDLRTYAEKMAAQEALRGEAGLLPTIAAWLGALVEAWHALALKVRITLDTLGDWLSAHAELVAATVLAVGAAGFAAWRWRAPLLWQWSRTILRMTPTGHVPLVAFRQLEQVARARRLGRAPGETVDEYLARLTHSYAEQGKDLRLLGRAFNLARYGQRDFNQAQAQRVLDAFAAAGAAIAQR